MLKNLRLKSKSANQGQKRLIKAGLTGSSNLVVRLISAGLGLISIPLTARYLGAERFGLWLILSAFISWISLADFGLSNSLKNVLSIAYGNKDQEKAKIALASAFFPILIICILLSILFWIIYPNVSWSKVFNVTSPQAIDDANSAVRTIFYLFIIRLGLSISPAIYSAYQEGYIFNGWDFISVIISVGSLILSIYNKASVTTLVLSYFGSSILGLVFSTIHIFAFRRPWLIPKLHLFHWQQAKELLKVGFHFWLAQIAAIIFFQTDLILVAQLFNSEDVARYGISLKLFAVINLVQVTFLSPLWPAYSEAISRKDAKWVTRTFWKSLTLSFIWCSSASFILILFGQEIIKTIVSPDLVPQQNLILAMALTTFLLGMSQAVAFFLNGMGLIKIQAALGFPSAILNLIASVILGKYLGVYGITLGTALTVAFSLSIFMTYAYKKIVKLESDCSGSK